MSVTNLPFCHSLPSLPAIDQCALALEQNAVSRNIIYKTKCFIIVILYYFFLITMSLNTTCMRPSAIR